MPDTITRGRREHFLGGEGLAGPVALTCWPLRDISEAP